jgi:outer membrane protein OmpA-like peptidoglycan-associated protein
MNKKSIHITTVLLLLATLPALSYAGRKQLSLSMAKDDVDLKNRTVYFKINRPADSAELKVYSIEGKLLAERTQIYNGAKAGDRLSVSWPALLGDDAENFRLELKVTDVDEFWVGTEIVKFYMEIPHEEVVFESAGRDIPPSEEPKLHEPLKILLDSIKKHGKNLDCKLYIGGHTDTVGGLAENRALSLKRARAIANYFKRGGVSIPLFVRGFGEELLAVPTEDNTPERKNRRAVYILSTFPPQMPGPGSWVRAH